MSIRTAGLGLSLLLVVTACGGSTSEEPASNSAVDPTTTAVATTAVTTTAVTATAATTAETVPNAEEPDVDTATTTTTTEPAPSEPWAPKTIDELADPMVLVDVDFSAGIPEGWYEQVWMKAGDGQGEVTAGQQGVRFTGRGGSTRSGIMTDLSFEVGDSTHLVLSVSGVVLEQGLSGTGWNGREAPLAVLVTYVDAEGTEHVGLGEDPAAPTTMFFRGFTALPEPDMVKGVAVAFREPFVHQFDLMELDPAPVTILAIGVEGAGWDPRVGEVYQLRFAAGN